MLPTPKLRTLLVCTIALLLLTATAHAQNTINVPKDQPTIQAGINAANTGDTVLVAPGTYPENIDFKGKAIFVKSFGGASVTTINGQKNTATVLFQNGEPRTAVLNGFTITGGQGNYEGTAGGIYISASSPTIVGNIIAANNCYGINSQASGPLIQNNTISGTLDSALGNCGFAAGAGIWIAFDQSLGQQTPTIIGNIIESNLYSGLEDAGGNGGGGIAIWGGNPVIESNIIRKNLTGEGPNLTARSEGGGIFFEGGGGLVVQNLIYGNMASFDGGGIAIESYLYGIGPIQLAFINNTITDNSVVPYMQQRGGPGGQQVFNDFLFEGYAWINNIITGSTTGASFVCQDFATSQPPSIFENNDFYNESGPVTGTLPNSSSDTCTYPIGTYGNISADPLFNAEATHDYHLESGSPAIDTGTNSALQFSPSFGAGPVTTDLDGNPRIQNTTGTPYPVIDMGAYETAGPTSPQATTILLTPSLYEAPGYGSITLTAQLLSAAGTPTGSVTFLMDGATLTAATIDSNGTATVPVAKLVPGIHTFVATYPGQSPFTPASSIHIYVFVDRYQTTLTANSSPNPSLVGQLVTFTATISSPEGGAPSPITFTDDIDPSNPVQLASITPDSKGEAVFTTSSLSTGNHPFDIAYAGDATHIGAGTYVTQDVSYASTSVLSVSPTAAAAGAGITLTATVSATSPPAAGSPTGTVDFYETSPAFPGGVFLNFAALNSSGVAAITLNYIVTGTITCTYSGDYNYAVSNCNSVPVTVTSTPLTPSTAALAVSPSTAKAGAPVGLTATISSTANTGPAPAGTVTFTETVPPATTPTTLQSVALTADSGVSTSSIALLSLTNLSTGVIGCTYSGDTTYAKSTCNSVPLTITSSAPSATATTLAITAAGAPVTTVPPGTVVTLTATTLAGTSPVSPGQVDFCDATASLCSDIHLIGIAQLTSAGTAVLRFIPGPGTHSYKAVFLGTHADTASSSAAEPLTVTTSASNAITTTLVATGNPGDYTLTATVSGALPSSPTGTVSFLDTTNNNYVLATGQLAPDASGPPFVNSSNPTFPIPQSGIASGVGAFAVGDFNGDGIQDLAVTQSPSSLFGFADIFLGDGKGSFSLSSSFATGFDPGHVIAADFNGDGYQDLAFSDIGSQAVEVWLNDGKGNFSFQSSYPVAYPLGIVARDFNGDGIADLATVDFSGGVTILLGNGDGSFRLIPAPATGLATSEIASADFNGDGIADLALTNSGDNTVSILLGNGDGTFTLKQTVSTGQSPGEVVTGDFNGDGKADLAEADGYGSTVTVYLGQGDGTFVLSATVNTGALPFYLAIGDFNGDGKADLIATDNADGSVTVMLGAGDGSFVASPFPTTSIDSPLAVGDFNADGKSDFALAIDAGNAFSVYLSAPPTASATATVANISPVGTGPHLVDANYPGDSIYAASLSNPVSLTAQRVPTTLTLATAVATSGSPITLTAALSPNLAQNHSATGLVTFSSNGNTLGTASVANGVATLAVPSLPAGLDALQAQYPGDTNFAPSSGTGSVTIAPPPPPDFTLTGPQTITFRTQSTGSATLTLTSLNSFSGPVALTCGLPQPTTYTCTLAPTTPTLAANATASSTLTLHPVLSAATSPANPSRILLATLCPLALLLFARRRRHRLAPLLTLALLAILTSALTACGSDVYTVATRPGSYPLTVTATGTASGTPTPTTRTLALNVVITP